MTRTIGIFGERASFTDEAAELYLRSVKLKDIKVKYFDTIDKALDAVSDKECDLSIIPYSNSSVGMIDATERAVAHARFKMISKVEIPIHHYLLAQKKMNIKQIQRIVSHPQALRQCRGYIKNHFPEIILSSAKSTAIAARELSEGKYGHETAAIGTKQAAQLYGLSIIDSNIEDHHDNSTTFLIVANPSKISRSYSKLKKALLWSSARLRS